MPELRKAGAPRPLKTRQQLLTIIAQNPWINSWPGATGATSVEDEGGVAKLIVYVVADYEKRALENTALRLTTEVDIPAEQIEFRQQRKE